MARYKFISKKKKDKIKLFGCVKEDIKINSPSSLRTEIISNKAVTVEGCFGVMDYRGDYVKLKVKKGYMIFCGKSFEITYFENETITVSGIITSIEFSV